MDGLDFSAIDQIDQDVFNGSQSESDGCEEMPLPDCIGIDSAVQDDEGLRADCHAQLTRSKTRSRTEQERDLELRVMKPNSIRRQILEKSIHGDNLASASSNSRSEHLKQRSHVMNITEKAGMSGIDKEKINQVIHEASRGSLFYRRQAQRQAEIHKSIEKMLNRVKTATSSQVEKARVTCDRLVDELEKQRVFSKVIVHFDLDMFFAAVEIRDNPDLKDKPVAVGGDSMVSTSNYVARRYGVRAAMPGFIAKKLCPDLILIKPNGFKYREASSEVFSILEQYDPELTSMSLDEAYLDLTEHVKNTLERDSLEYQEYYDGTLPKVWWTRASEVVEEIRQAIFDKTQLTCSAGIACNTLLAKISTDINKPNGQFMVQGYSRDVIDFISRTPVEKVSGIGKVSAQFLNALEIKTCGDIYEKRHFLPLVFYEINVKFYLRVALGDGSTSIKSEEQRKSKSVERTFSAVKDTSVLIDKLDNICEELCSRYLKPYRIRGRTVTVKLKRNTFMTTTKSYSMLVPTNDKLVIYSAAKNLLMSEIANEPPEISYRLLGVKLSNLADDEVTTNQLTIDAMFRNQEMGKSTKTDSSVFQVEDSCMSHNSEERLAIEGPSDYASDVKPEIHITNDELEIPPWKDRSNQQASGQNKQKRNLVIESFFKKRNQTDNSNLIDVKPSMKQVDEPNNAFVSEGSIDTKCNIDRIKDFNEASNREQQQNQPNDDDFQCPYCFKPFADFMLLERHVDECKMKISIDVNRSLSQRLINQQSPASRFFSQLRTQRTHKTPSPGARRSSRLKTQQIKESPGEPASQFVSPANRNLSTQDGSASYDRKVSFYERFIESNSQSLRQSVRAEPYQCPYCTHGFLTFSSLESHVVMCTKKCAAT